MQIKNGTQVFTSDSNVVGRIDRVVIDPRTDEITHLIIRQGFLFTEDKVLPMTLVASANEHEVTLKPNVQNLDGLPPFEEAHYIPRSEVDDTTNVTPIYGYAPYGAGALPAYTGWIAAPMLTDPDHVEVIEQNIPPKSAAFSSGARVISYDDQHVGEVESIYIDPRSNQATHFVISQGLLFKNRKIVPSTWIRMIAENEVYLGVDADTLKTLPDYHPN